MTHTAFAYALRHRPFQDTPAKPPRNRRFSIPLIELIRPESFWPYPLSIERAFELMRWMIDTGGPQYRSQLRWGTAGVEDLLSATSGLGHHSIVPIASLDDLRKRFHYALLARPQSEGQERWRTDHNIDPAAAITVNRPTYRPFDGAAHLGWRSENDIAQALARMCTGTTGKRMAVALNSFHKHFVNWVHHVRVCIYKDRGFSFILSYGENPERGGASKWGDTLARTRHGESFLDTMARARDVFDCLVHGKVNGADLADMFEFGHIGQDYIAGQIAALPPT